MSRKDRKIWTRFVKNQDDTAKLATYKQQIRDNIQEFGVSLSLYASFARTRLR